MSLKANEISLTKNNFLENSQLKQGGVSKPSDISITIQSSDNIQQIENNRKKFFFKKIGKLIILYETENEIIYVMGPLFPILFLVDITVNILIYKFVFNNITMIFKTLGGLINIVQVGLMTYSSIINPGLPLKQYNTMIYEDENKNAQNFRQCKDCKFWINTDENTIHCRKCKICIEGYDHHCNCMNICIGKNNIKYFYISMLTTFVLIIYAILITLSYK